MLGASEARADEPRPVRFALTTAAGESPLDACGGEEALVRSVAERLRRPPFVALESADIGIEVSFDPDGARIVEEDRRGRELGRRDVPLPAGDCEKARETLAVVLAIMIGPERATTEPPPEAAPPPPTPEEPAPPRAEAPAPPARRRRPARWTVAPVAEGAVGTGVLPGVAWGLGVGAIVTPPVPRVYGLIRAELWPSQRTATRPSAGVDRLGGALLGCIELFRGADATLSACGGASGGRLRARSTSLSRGSDDAFVLGVLAEARFGYRLPTRGAFLVEPILAAQVAALLKRDRFTYRAPDGRELTLLQPAPIAVQGTFGVAVHFL